MAASPHGGSGKAVVSGAVPAATPDRIPQDPMIGRVLDGRFTIEMRLGAGSMGTVYKAKQHAMGRDVAIKILRSDRALDESSRARFLREARANSLLASPHTVTVFDFGQADNGDFFLAMELLEGESLGQRLQREKRLSPELAVDVTRQALKSLAEAHAKGIIHRDLKPDNLFFSRMAKADEHGQRQHEEVIKVVDFGIAKMLSAENAAMNAVETQAGTVFGTPRYMSPEQAQGKTLDARSDLYSLGVILYHTLTGRPPFTDDDAIVVMARHIKTPPKRPTEACPQANIPADLETALMRILAKDPTQRPASAEAMSQELARAMSASATGTSGVRISLSGSTMPPPSANALAPISVPQAAGLSPMAVPTPGGAHVVPKPPESLSELPSSTESVQIAAGIPSKRSKRGAIVGVAALAAVAAGLVMLLGVHREAPARNPVGVTRQLAPAPPSPIPPVPADTSASAPPSTATSQAASAVTPPASSSAIPSVNFSALPRATEAPALPPTPTTRPSARNPHPARPASPHPAPTAAPTATATGHYGLFE